MDQAVLKLPQRPVSSTGVSSYSTPVKCKICGDRGIVLVRGGEAVQPCKCMEQRRMERLFKTSKITPAFRSKNFGNFKNDGLPVTVRRMFESAKDYVKRFKDLGENNWLVLLGEPGCGKTHLSMAVANNLLSKGMGILYFQYVEGMSEMKAILRKSSDIDKDSVLDERLNAMKKVEVLVWDDLFKGRDIPTDFELERTFEVLNYRYLNLLPTIISSERNEEELYRIDKGIARRIIERGKGHMAIIEGIEANYSLRGDK
jgi:DNA replication protein DnaC